MSILDELPPELRRQIEQADSGGLSSDDALAIEYVERFGDDMRYCAQWSKWMIYDGARWREDGTRQALHNARLVGRDAAAATTSAKARLKLSSVTTAAAIERFAQCDPLIAATTDQWDLNLDVLNTPAGVIDLSTGEVGPHVREQYHTKMTAVAPAPVGTPCPLWERFLTRVTAGDPELASFLQRVVGYSLTGLTHEHALFFLYGTGRNGKGVFLNTITRILGDYASVASMETFTVSNAPQHPTDLAALRGARMVTAQETEDGRRWAEAKIKALTGGDPITARFMRQDFFTFTPQFKLLIAGNHKPGLRGVDEAIRARFNLIPFTVTIPREERDPELPEKLRGEWPAILRWAIDGCLAWREIGLKPPLAVTEATDQYLTDEDSFSIWLDECCEIDPCSTETSAALFASWKAWAERSGENPGTCKRFAATMETRCFEPTRDKHARRYRGVRIKRTDYTNDPRYR